MFIRDKRGQVTVFIIIALVIIASVILISYFWNDIKTINVETSPQKYLESCMGEPIKNSLSTILSQGGVVENKNFYFYNNKKIEYLCYTNEYYKTCVNQYPFLKDSVEKELGNLLRPFATACLDSLKKEMENKGYTVNSASSKSDLSVNITLNKVDYTIDNSVVFKKADSSQSFTSFKITKNSKSYDLLMSAVYIINWEARYGDFDTLTFMMSYPDLRLEKQKQSDGSKIYILSSRSTLEVFNFASRSISWPPGFAVDERVGE